MNDVVAASVPAPVGMTPMAMLDAAVRSGAGIEIIDKLMSLQERWEKNEARKAFDAAIAEARAAIKPVEKNRVGHNQKRYADMAAIANAVDEALSKNGLSYRYQTEQTDNQVKVTCILAHRDGHFETTTLREGRDTTGNKTPIHALGSTLTYLQRYSLVQMLGLAVTDDDDGHAAGTGETISSDQITELQTLITTIGGARADTLKAGFLKKFRIESLVELPVTEWNNAKAALEAKRAKP